MKHSESLANLAASLVEAQAEMDHAVKNSTNPHFRNKYANLAEVIDTIRPVLARHGLSIVQVPGYENGVVTLTSMLLHKSGEWIMGESGSPAPKQDPQGVGSAVTYLRRYSLAAICNITQDDDDGEAAVGRSPKAQPEVYDRKHGVINTATGEVTPSFLPMDKPAAKASREHLGRLIGELRGVVKAEDKAAVTRAETAMNDESATAERILKATNHLTTLLNKYKPTDPFRAEEREQDLELAI